jgi:hypothetical protein
MDDLIGHSIAYRVAMGARAGQKAFTLQTVPPQLGEEEREGVARAAADSGHAGPAFALLHGGRMSLKLHPVASNRATFIGRLYSPGAARYPQRVRPLQVRFP